MLGGIQPSEADQLTIWQFTAMRTLWNRRHKSATEGDDGEPVERPAEDFVRQRQEELRQLGIAGSA